jgi:hypothetical protein
MKRWPLPMGCRMCRSSASSLRLARELSIAEGNDRWQMTDWGELAGEYRIFANSWDLWLVIGPYLLSRAEAG